MAMSSEYVCQMACGVEQIQLVKVSFVQHLLINNFGMNSLHSILICLSLQLWTVVTLHLYQGALYHSQPPHFSQRQHTHVILDRHLEITQLLAKQMGSGRNLASFVVGHIYTYLFL